MCDEEFNDRAYYDMSPSLEEWKARAEKAEAALVDAEERAEIAEAKLSRVRTHLRNGGPTDAVALYFLFDGVT